MQRKTHTTLDNLRIGDRFTYGSNKTDVWEVVQRFGNNTEVNQREAHGKWKMKFNIIKRSSTQVYFLRHTKPLNGDECFIEDLQEGDVFWKPDNVMIEYVVIDKGHEFSKVRKMYDKQCKEPEMAGRLASVFFVRQGSKEVKS
jgi:hypothetical protein